MAWRRSLARSTLGERLERERLGFHVVRVLGGRGAEDDEVGARGLQAGGHVREHPLRGKRKVRDGALHPRGVGVADARDLGPGLDADLVDQPVHDALEQVLATVDIAIQRHRLDAELLPKPSHS